MRHYSNPQKPKISRKALDSLLPVSIEELEAEGEEKQCIICYNDYNVSNPEGVTEQPLRLPKCRHIFGDVCIKQWFEDNITCPYCRDKLPVEAVNYRDSMEQMLLQAASVRAQARMSRERTRLSGAGPRFQDTARNPSVGGSGDANPSENSRRSLRISRIQAYPRSHDFTRSNIPQRAIPGSSQNALLGSGSRTSTVGSNTTTYSPAQQPSPAVAIGSVALNLSSPTRLSGFNRQPSVSRRYSGEGVSRPLNTRNAILRGNSSPLSLSSASSSTTGSPGNNAMFGPSERQLAMGSPRPLSQQLSNQFTQYQTPAPWAASESPWEVFFKKELFFILFTAFQLWRLWTITLLKNRAFCKSSSFLKYIQRKLLLAWHQRLKRIRLCRITNRITTFIATSGCQPKNSDQVVLTGIPKKYKERNNNKTPLLRATKQVGRFNSRFNLSGLNWKPFLQESELWQV